MYKGTNLKERWSSGGQTNGRSGFNLKLNIKKSTNVENRKYL